MAGSNHFFTVSVSEAVTSEFLDTRYFRRQPSYCFESAAKGVAVRVSGGSERQRLLSSIRGTRPQPTRLDNPVWQQLHASAVILGRHLPI